MAKIPKGMKLTSLIQKWLDEQEWKGEIEIDAEAQTSEYPTAYEIDSQNYRLFIGADEKRQWLSVFLYGPMGIPENRYDEACKLVNSINLSIGVGRLAAVKNSNFQFKAVTDFEGVTPTTTMISNMLGAGASAFQEWTGEMGQLIFSGKSADQIFEELEKAQQQREAGEGVPDKL